MSAPIATYRLFGLKIASQLHLPELTPIDESDKNADVRIILSDVPADLPRQPGLHHVGSASLLNVAGVARYLCQDGSRLLVEPVPGAPHRNVRLFLLGSGMALVLHRRGLLPLHGNSVVVDGRACLFLGPSGSGKSTLASRLIRRDYPFLADDVSVVRIEAEGRAVVEPGLPRLRLWRDAIERTGGAVDALPRSYIEDGEPFEKFDVPATRIAHDPAPLGSIVILDRDGEPSLTRIAGAEAVTALLANIYRGEYLNGKQHSVQWQACVRLAAGVPVLKWRRRWGYEDYESELDKLLAGLGDVLPDA